MEINIDTDDLRAYLTRRNIIIGGVALVVLVGLIVFIHSRQSNQVHLLDRDSTDCYIILPDKTKSPGVCHDKEVDQNAT